MSEFKVTIKPEITLTEEEQEAIYKFTKTVSGIIINFGWLHALRVTHVSGTKKYGNMGASHMPQLQSQMVGDGYNTLPGAGQPRFENMIYGGHTDHNTDVMPIIGEKVYDFCNNLKTFMDIGEPYDDIMAGGKDRDTIIMICIKFINYIHMLQEISSIVVVDPSNQSGKFGLPKELLDKLIVI